MWSPWKNFHFATNAILTPQSSWRILPGSFANDVKMLYMCVCEYIRILHLHMYMYVYVCICFLIFDNETMRRKMKGNKSYQSFNHFNAKGLPLFFATKDQSIIKVQSAKSIGSCHDIYIDFTQYWT